jgi:hypothetical protein
VEIKVNQIICRKVESFGTTVPPEMRMSDTRVVAVTSVGTSGSSTVLLKHTVLLKQHYWAVADFTIMRKW